MSRKKLLLFLIILTVAASGTVFAGGRKEMPVEEPEAPAESSAPVVAEKPESDAPSYPPAGWVTDVREAVRKAEAEDKEILIDFTGSDWCVWCQKLEKEVFSTREFMEYAEENLVLLFVDFPSGIDLSEQQMMHNQMLAQLMSVQGYPTIWLMEKDLAPIMATGYRDGGVEEYIRHLEEDRPEVSKTQKDEFRASLRSALEANLGSF